MEELPTYLSQHSSADRRDSVHSHDCAHYEDASRARAEWTEEVGGDTSSHARGLGVSSGPPAQPSRGGHSALASDNSGAHRAPGGERGGRRGPPATWRLSPNHFERDDCQPTRKRGRPAKGDMLIIENDSERAIENDSAVHNVNSKSTSAGLSSNSKAWPMR
eukprot:6195422-Pleurochrysis_carterae.AAC.1